jgi:glycerol transport system substrate-binding protein
MFRVRCLVTQKRGQMLKRTLVYLLVAAFMSSQLPSFAQGDRTADQVEAIISKWADAFEPSALTREERIAELRWFYEVSKEFRGRSIKSVAEDIETHFWERDVLAEAFLEITGIHVTQDIMPEGDLVRNITEQMMTGRMLYDIYVNDADFTGTHLRLGKVVNLTEYMRGDGKRYTDPWLDLDDFLNLEFGQDYDGNILQLPDQQFPILYWFRYDWFTDPGTKNAFFEKYGYELGVPLNWTAYRDIAEFFTGRQMRNPNGSVVKAWGHLDYGKPSPSLGWRFTDAWLSAAGMGDKGLPNGIPVDEWGIRVEDRIPVGSMMERGGALNSPAAIYALTTYLDWMKKYAPPFSMNIEWSEVGPIPGDGEIAQTIYFCGTFAAYPNYHKIGSPVCDAEGEPVWRVAPQPHGKYWEEGMKVGYQDCGSWTIPTNVRGKRRAMAWLWAQFSVSKTVSVKKFIVGGTPVRRSTVRHPYVISNSKKWGGLVEFYLSPDEKKFTDTGLNVPHYPALSGIWWSTLAKAVRGDITPEEAMNELALAQDDMLAKLKLKKYSPKLNPIMGKEYWLKQPGGPKAEIVDDPPPRTVDYDRLLEQWKIQTSNGDRR